MFNIQNISAEQLENWLQNEDTVLIDVRTPNEVAQGAIENHLAIPLHLIPLEMDRIRNMKGKVVIYCRTGARSAQACAFLQNNGISNVYNLQGGIMDWARNGKKIVSSQSRF